ncbi:MAG: DMT family transporter [Desulfitobacteriia bacterium]
MKKEKMNKDKLFSHDSALLPLAAGTITAVIWGFSFVFTKDVLSNTYPSQLLGLRFGAAALALTVLKLTGLIRVNFQGKNWLSLIPLALCQPVIYFLGETWGIKWTTASEAGMIIAFVPVFSAIAAGIFLKEKIHKLQLAAILLSVAGVIIVVTAQGKIEFNQHLWGILALLLAVVSAGFYSLLSKKSSADFTPVEITFVMMWVGALLFNLLGVLEGLLAGNISNYLAPLGSFDVAIGVIYLGVLSSVLAFFLYNYALSRLKVSQSAPLLNLATVVSVVAGVLIQHDPFSWRHAIGITLIILGVWGNNIFANPIEK